MALIGRVIGILSGGSIAALWVAVIWFPVGGFMLEGVAVPFGALMAIVGLVAAIASWHGHAAIVFACFVASFFGVGARALNAETWFRVFGLLDLSLLLAAALLWTAARKTEANS